jgi:dCTP deaminase
MIINGVALLSDPPITSMYHKKLQANGVSYGLSELGYDIRIKQDVIFMPWRYIENIPPSVQVLEPGGHHGKIEYGNFTLASSIEEFCVPNYMGGIVHDKSTWARHGLSVYNTVIEPGWRGFLTLELVYNGNKPLHIPAGSGIAQVIFHRVSHPAEYQGKYQDQGNRPVKPILKQT